jgi:hypothetical protein
MQRMSVRLVNVSLSPPRGRTGLAVACMLLMTVGCAPALDWREVRPPDLAWAALFPCRPAEQTRQLKVGDGTTAWRLTVCEAGGVTVAMGDGDLGDPALTGPALRALHGAALQRIGAQGVQALPFRWAGMTPQAEAGHWRMQGQDAGGKPMRVELWLVSHGTRVVQAMMFGQALTDASVQTFSDGLGFPP